jgi:hypothetical protein
MKLILTTLVALLLSATAQAQTWIHHDTIDQGVQVYLDRDSIRPASYWANRYATVSVGVSGEETSLLFLEVNCAHNTMRYNGKWSGTQPNQTMGKLVRTICAQRL